MVKQRAKKKTKAKYRKLEASADGGKAAEEAEDEEVIVIVDDEEEVKIPGKESK